MGYYNGFFFVKSTIMDFVETKCV